jgi:hypothetical protein
MEQIKRLIMYLEVGKRQQLKIKQISHLHQSLLIFLDIILEKDNQLQLQLKALQLNKNKQKQPIPMVTQKLHIHIIQIQQVLD